MTKHGPKCSVCAHRELAQIHTALARGVAAPAIARRFKLGRHAVYRHAQRHLPPQLKASLLAPDLTGVDLDTLKETESQSLLAHLVALRNRLFNALDVAEEFHDASMLTRVSSQIHQNLELVARLIGDLNIGGTTNVNVLVLPQYVELRLALVDALGPYPEARQAVAAALHAIESKAADSIGKRDAS